MNKNLEICVQNVHCFDSTVWIMGNNITDVDCKLSQSAGIDGVNLDDSLIRKVIGSTDFHGN